jgi:hypothetical protein
MKEAYPGICAVPALSNIGKKIKKQNENKF